MLKRLLASGIAAGLGTGLVAAFLQFSFITPLLFEGELYETGERVHWTDASPESLAAAPPILGDLWRHVGTLAFDFVTYAGFGLLLVVAYGLAEARGAKIDARRGLIWGLAGFVAVQLAPAFGLPPELPGTIAAELQARQIWWVLTVAASIAGLAAVAFGTGPVVLIGGAALILAPHIVGAPHLDRYYGVAPPELAAQFATRSLGVAAMSWAVLGALSGWFWQRFTP